MHGTVLHHTPSHLPTHEQMANGSGSADDPLARLRWMRVRIKGARAALAGWEPDILGLSMRWPFCQMMSRPDPQSSELGPQKQRQQKQSDPLVGNVCGQRI